MVADTEKQKECLFWIMQQGRRVNQQTLVDEEYKQFKKGKIIKALKENAWVLNQINENIRNSFCFSITANGFDGRRPPALP